MKGLLDKTKFYEALKPFANKHTGIYFHFRFGEHYELIFNWQNEKPNGDFNPDMFVQLIDLNVSGSRRYVTQDLRIDSAKEKVDTDYRLYKRLNRWVTDAIQAYESR